MAVGDLERRVLDALLADGRASAAEVAATADVAAVTVDDARRRLEADGVITGYRPRIDYGRFGYDLTAILEVTVTGEHRDAVRDRLEALSHVVDCYEVTGPTDLVAVAKFRSPADLDAETRTLVSHEAVESVSVHVVLETHAEGRHPPIVPEE